MTIINGEHTIFANVAAAQKVVDTIDCDEDGWEYRVKADPQGTGRAVIEAYDGEGEFLGLL